MNAMQIAMTNAIPKTTQFKKLTGEVERAEHVPLAPHVVTKIKSNGEGKIIKARKETRSVLRSVRINGSNLFRLTDTVGDTWIARQVGRGAYQAVS